jgi:NAD(P)-dependent dehydrogenase (short-subunit alcohol dehydrogenase family)
MGRLEDKVAVVVGAGSAGDGFGNGRACAVAYAREGAAVMCVDFDLARAQETVAAITGEGGRALAAKADATSEADMQAVMDATVIGFGHIDVVHNNVGVGRARGLPDQVTPDAWRNEIDQDLTSAYLGIRSSVPHRRANGGGVIINTSSVLAVRFLRRVNVAYTAAKAGVEAMTRACAVGYGPENIRVNCLRIGFSETPAILGALEPIPDDVREQELSRSRRKVPLRGEHGDPFDVANAAVFLASEGARHITGVILNVDGGLECAPL